MYRTIVSSLLAVLASTHESGAFSIVGTSPSVVKKVHHGRTTYNPSSTFLNHHRIQQHHQSDNISNHDDVSLEGDDDGGHRLKRLARLIGERSDTMRAAGFYDNEASKDFVRPVHAGAKTNITLFLLALGYKWYRSVFINKMAIWERQPQWNTVITSKEDEEKANLEALTCKSCGATIFIAKGRKWFQMPRGYECYVCGASGNENFENTRADLLEEIDDDYFDYEKPLDFVTAAERRKLMKEAGGDEEKAIALLTQKNKDAAEAEEAEGGDILEEAPKKKKKKKKGKKKKKKAAVDAENVKVNGNEKEKKNVDDDDLDVLGMDG